MLRATALCLCVVWAVACGESPGGGGIADAGSGADAGPGGGGLIFELVMSPALPDVGAGVAVDEVRFELRDLRAIGDSAPGDSRTTMAQVVLEWRPQDAPPRIAFPLAPPGIYSTLEARFGGAHEAAFEIRGSVRLPSGGEPRPFRIENDELAAAISLDLQGLTVGTTPRTAVISVSLAFLGQVPWEQVSPQEDELRIEDGDPQMAAVVAGLAAAFSFSGAR